MICCILTVAITAMLLWHANVADKISFKTPRYIIAFILSIILLAADICQCISNIIFTFGTTDQSYAAITYKFCGNDSNYFLVANSVISVLFSLYMCIVITVAFRENSKKIDVKINDNQAIGNKNRRQMMSSESDDY